ncbi:hypothetical protein [Pseudomonas chlororaphis]|uniref:hypothetical protein n=1 Tax=Pseudomonas chlororaphis TaxID=587753 RepID=UPI0006A639EF|nr:hypothetical protein [Pseudomonas chlororaphis]AZD00669.1 hypothetical protein C4K27_1460 [Pseudomonas chlororaphis subsp. chlororaphis]MBM0283434.1 hypothetical protein [Pseudomonas chlororaphis]MDO1503760.1 hypothetical protein [Pseudomonas chlororaphis]ORM48821.1 hypothetical protein B6D51_04980 [Pseudomonas chlororaphis subsp. chlororaphis]TWR95078.1 hypothetical protein FJD36_18725 [Pseudomonas chlororaphis subsp. chlororaphis]
MTDLLINEQLIIIGAVDIPLNNDNTMKLLKVFGEMGYLPSVVQEINMQTGQAINRMSLVNNADTAITFNTDRISFIRNPNPVNPAPTDFTDLIRVFADRLAAEFNLKANRCVISKEMLMGECSEEKMNKTAALFLNAEANDDEDVFEWFARRSIGFEHNDEKLLKVSEVGRAQGKILLNSVLTDFDRVRIKAEVGTDFYNQENRLDIKNVSALVLSLSELHADFISGLVRNHHES